MIFTHATSHHIDFLKDEEIFARNLSPVPQGICWSPKMADTSLHWFKNMAAMTLYANDPLKIQEKSQKKGNKSSNKIYDKIKQFWRCVGGTGKNKNAE